MLRSEHAHFGNDIKNPFIMLLYDVYARPSTPAMRYLPTEVVIFGAVYVVEETLKMEFDENPRHEYSKKGTRDCQK